MPVTHASSFSTAPDASLYRNLWRHAAGSRVLMLLAFSLLIASQLVRLAIPWCAAQAIDSLQRDGSQGLRAAASWVGTLLAVQAAVWILHGPGRVLERRVGVGVRRGVASHLYDKLLRAPLAWHDRQHSAELQHRVSQSSHALYQFAQTQFIYLQSAVNFAGPLLALVLLSQVTGACALLGYAVVGFVLVRFDGALMALAGRENEAERKYTAGLFEFLGRVGTLKALRLQEASRRMLARRLDRVFAPIGRAIVLNEARWCTVDLMSAVLTWTLVAVYALREVSNAAPGALMMGGLFMVYQYAQQAGSVVGSLAANVQTFARTRSDFASADLIRQAPDEPAPGMALDTQWSRLELRDLCFDRAPCDHDTRMTPGLRHIALSLQRGERVALVGASGAGKSTLMRVLAGLYQPTRGHVEVDGVVQLNVHHLGSLATFIPQDADVFEGTARENIVFDGEVDATALDRAVVASVLDVVCAEWPQGLDTPIAERGANWSGGQRQRLALARGLYAARGRSLLLLDEPTSALDLACEAQVWRRLKQQFPHACIVASIHRLSLLEHFDRVVLMDQGCIVDAGRVDEVVLRQPFFAHMQRDSASHAPTAVA